MSSYEYTDEYGASLSVESSVRPRNATLRFGDTRKIVWVPAEKVEEVCAALREAAGLPPVWTVEKGGLAALDSVIRVNEDGLVDVSPLQGLAHFSARHCAARLLAAADEAEALANRPKLPTAEGSVVLTHGIAYTRMSEGGVWMKAGSDEKYYDSWFADDFTILRDPDAEKAS